MPIIEAEADWRAIRLTAEIEISAYGHDRDIRGVIIFVRAWR